MFTGLLTIFVFFKKLNVLGIKQNVLVIQKFATLGNEDGRDCAKMLD